MFYIRNPKIYEWTIGFIYGENKIYRSNNMPGTAPSFSQQFEVSTIIVDYNFIVYKFFAGFATLFMSDYL